MPADRTLTRTWASIYAPIIRTMCGIVLLKVTDLVDLVLPRFVHEGKKYATIAIGCTGGRHRSVYLIECLAAHLSSRLAAMHAAGESGLDWRQTVTHRELRLALKTGWEGSGGGAIRGIVLRPA